MAERKRKRKKEEDLKREFIFATHTVCYFIKFLAGVVAKSGLRARGCANRALHAPRHPREILPYFLGFLPFRRRADLLATTRTLARAILRSVFCDGPASHTDS